MWLLDVPGLRLEAFVHEVKNKQVKFFQLESGEFHLPINYSNLPVDVFITAYRFQK